MIRSVHVSLVLQGRIQSNPARRPVFLVAPILLRPRLPTARKLASASRATSGEMGFVLAVWMVLSKPRLRMNPAPRVLLGRTVRLINIGSLARRSVLECAYLAHQIHHHLRPAMILRLVRAN